jgi:hypothetical protein
MVRRTQKSFGTLRLWGSEPRGYEHGTFEAKYCGTLIEGNRELYRAYPCRLPLTASAP